VVFSVMDFSAQTEFERLHYLERLKARVPSVLDKTDTPLNTGKAGGCVGPGTLITKYLQSRQRRAELLDSPRRYASIV
jgi:hypothetical protein